MEERSIIMWALENLQDELKEFCWINEEGELEGEYARDFKQAIRLEGTYKSQGKHPAGVIVSSERLSDIIPMVKAARSSDQLAGMDMNKLADLGCVKFDILGLSLLDRIYDTVNDINCPTS
jgi:DNA polymerase-3 subunit alpha